MRSRPESGWHTAGERPPGPRFTWNAVLWSLVYPRRRQRVGPTVSGVLLVGISFGIGTAAYNAANNILFITLSLLLACLIASGVLSWLNFRHLSWRLDVEPPMRVGFDAAVTLRIRNGKRLLPTYGLWFDLSARALETGPAARAETTFTARGADVRAALAQADRDETRGRLFLRTRLDPGAEIRLDWSFPPARRGRTRIELRSVGSLFPFGFLRKEFTVTLSRDVVVWPAPVDYRRFAAAGARRTTGGERIPRSGSGEDLFALRRYQLGDSHRLIHWKASARTRQLLVRQFGAETAEAFSLWLRADEPYGSGSAQFELLLGFAATLAEDLFRAGKLTRLALNAEPPRPARRLQDLEAWLDQLAVLSPGAPDDSRAGAAAAAAREAIGSAARGRSLITFVADGSRGVAARIDGQRFAAA